MQRVREKEHVDGNWACTISLSVTLPESELLNPLREALGLYRQPQKNKLLPLQMTAEPFHISLSKTFYIQIQHHNFVRDFIEKRLLFEPYPIFEGINTPRLNPCKSFYHQICGNCLVYTTGEWEIFSNESKTCFFLALMIDGKVGYASLETFVERINVDLMSKFGWPLFFTDPKFHISLIWSTDEVALRTFQSEQKDLLKQLADNLLEIPMQHYMQKLYPENGETSILALSTIPSTDAKEATIYVVKMLEKENRFNPTSVLAWNQVLDFVTAGIEKTPKEFKGAVLITMTGYQDDPNAKIYSNGLDLTWLLQSKDFSFVAKSFLGLLMRFLCLPIPTIAVVNGHAFAGGCLLALCHDYRVMRSDRGYMCMNEILLPSPLSNVMSSILRAKLKDPKECRDCALQAKRYDAREGLKAGLVDLIVEINSNSNEQRNASHVILQQTVSFVNDRKLGQLSGKSKHIYGLLKRSLYLPVLDAYEQEKSRIIDMREYLKVGKL